MELLTVSAVNTRVDLRGVDWYALLSLFHVYLYFLPGERSQVFLLNIMYIQAVVQLTKMAQLQVGSTLLKIILLL